VDGGGKSGDEIVFLNRKEFSTGFPQDGVNGKG
jgi:hypothetical protein